MNYLTAKASDTGIIIGCCAMVLFNTATRQGRYFRGEEIEPMRDKIVERAEATMASLGVTKDDDEVKLAPFLCEAVRLFIEEAPISTEEIANIVLGHLDRPPIKLDALPEKLADGNADRHFLMDLMGVEYRKHRNNMGRRLASVIEEAIKGVLPSDGPVPMLVIPLDKDGEPDMDRAHEYAPGTEAYDEIVKQVIEPNRVPGNGTVH